MVERMNSDDLIALAGQEQRKAHALLDALDLMNRLQQIGTPVLTGSIRTGLMHCSDIDISLHTEALEVGRCFDVLRALAQFEDIVTVIFFENKRRKSVGGYFIDLGCHYRGRSWQIQIAVFDATCAHAHLPEATTAATLAALDDRTRHTILALKAERRKCHNDDVVDGPWAIGGNSMGGFGAVRLGLKYPRHFCSVWAHSSCFPTADALPEHWHWTGDPHDLDCYALARKADPAVLPRLTFDCGHDDHLLEQNRRFHAFLEQRGMAHAYHEHPGGHDWDYWDAHVQGALAQHLNVWALLDRRQ